MEFKCPQCERTVVADESARGQVVECPHCGKGIVVPRKVNISSVASARTKSPIPLSPRPLTPIPLSATPLSPRPLSPRKHDATSDRAELRSTEHSDREQTIAIQPVHMEHLVQSPHPSRPSPFSSLADKKKADDTHEEERRNRPKERMALIVVATAFVIMCGYTTGGLLHMARQSSARYEELLERIERNSRNIHEEVDPSKEAVESKMSQIADRIKELEDAHAALKRDFGSALKRLTDVEELADQSDEDLVKRSKLFEEKHAVLLQRIELLSQQVNTFISARQLEQSKLVVQLPTQPQAEVEDKPSAPTDSPHESIEDLRLQLKNNLAEIKRLRESNPSCYLNPKPTDITNVRKTSKGDKYSINSMTFVRDRFYCTKCKGVNPPCDVCRQRSFNSWREARDNVEETKKINSRIAELQSQVTRLKKQISAISE